MSTGSAAGAVCYATQVEAATAWCSAAQGITSAGAVSCIGTSGAVAGVGGAGSFSWTQRLVDATGQTTSATIAGQPLTACETYSFDYWSPYLVAFFAAGISIVAAQLLYRVFGSDRDN